MGTITYDDIKRVSELFNSIPKGDPFQITFSMNEWETAEKKLKRYFDLNQVTYTQREIEKSLCQLAFMAQSRAISLEEMVEMIFPVEMLFKTDFCIKIDRGKGFITLLDLPASA